MDWTLTMSGQTVQVLLIEDNPGDARLIRESLRETTGLQFELAHVTRLDTALEYIAKESADVLLLDLGLPDAEGLEALVRILEAVPALPVVVLTGLDDETIGAKAISLGAQDYLVKGQANATLLARVMRYAIERKRTEVSLAQKTNELEQFFELTLDLLCIADTDGNFLRVNKAWETILGYPVQELERQKFLDFVHPDDMDRTLKAMARLDNQESVLDFVNRYRSFDGTYRFIEWRTQPQGKLIYAAARDITERLKSQDILHQQHRYLLSLQETTLDLVSQLDLDKLLENIVQRAGDLTGTSAVFLDLIDPETNRLIPKVGLGILADSINFELQPGEGVAGIVWQTGQPLIVNDYANWPGRIRGLKEKLVGSIVAVPLLADSKVQGVLGLAYDASTEATFGPEIIEVLNQFSRLATVAIQNARLFSQVEQELWERKQAEEALRLQSAALEAAANAIVITDIEGNIQWANPAFTTLTGYTVDEATGKNPRELVKSGMHDEPFYKNMWDTILTGNVWQGELINRRKDGSLYTEEQTITHLKNTNGEISHFIAIKQDITERKQAENDRIRLLTQVREQSQRIRQIIDTVPQGIVLLSEAGQVMLTNLIAERDLAVLSGNTENDLIKHIGNYALPELLASRDRQEITVDGQTFVTIARPLQENFDSKNWVLVIDDVTEQRTTQRYQHAQERLATVGQLAAGIAHDFNNVMSVINLYAQLLQNIPDLSPKSQQHLTLIRKQAQQAADLIAQILDFSRRSDIEQQPLDLLPLMKEFIKLLKHTLPENISLSLPYDQKGYVVLADPTRLQQAFMNLAFNARDAMPDGGKLSYTFSTLTLTGEETAPLPDMSAGKWVHLAVADTGTGIAPEHIHYVFDPFFTTKEVGKGTGLGLSQVYGIIKQHGGFIDLQSQVGKGTTFNIYLPLVSIPAPNVLSNSETGMTMGQGETVLVVEDNEVMRLSVTESLTHLGYKVLAAAESAEAQTMLGRDGIVVDMVLTDMVMPGMDGVQLINVMQQKYPDMKFLIMTGHTLEEGRLEALQETAVPWIQKPFTVEQLAQKIRSVLDSQIYR
jgi:two-component system, cell cycle sensor histidine kinase and response regulator CckA